MSIRKRNTLSGQTSEYHYEFMQSGKRYYGVCEGCTTERTATTFEKNIKSKVKKLAEQDSIGALVENFKYELIGGSKITLEKAFDLYLAKPRRKQPSKKQQGINRSQWNDFYAFLTDMYPDITQLDKVTRQQAEAYIEQLRNNGRYLKTVQYNRSYKLKTISPSYQTQTNLSARTVNAFHKTLKSVFAKLKEDSGIIYNPFDFDMLDNDSESREAFTPEELSLIGENLNEFVKPIFIFGICSGLSKGDICNLKWNAIQDGWIITKRRKTGSSLEIPILPPLAVYLAEQRNKTGNNEYILPEHASMYESNPSGISYRVKIFLEDLGIVTTRKGSVRGRASSIKDIHSLRHTFAYMAGCYQIPLPIVQSILGHMSSEMTKHYQAHADRKAKEKYLAQMPNFLDVSAEQKKISEYIIEPERLQLKKLADTLPLDKIKQIIKNMEC